MKPLLNNGDAEMATAYLECTHPMAGRRYVPLAEHGDAEMATAYLEWTHPMAGRRYVPLAERLLCENAPDRSAIVRACQRRRCRARSDLNWKTGYRR